MEIVQKLIDVLDMSEGDIRMGILVGFAVFTTLLGLWMLHLVFEDPGLNQKWESAETDDDLPKLD